MARCFNVTGVCVPAKHYMVNLQERIEQIRKMIDAGNYFTINCARQYGKTTTLAALERALCEEYFVISLDFQALGSASFPKPVILMIDEIDSASNNQVFLDFLAQLRSYYLERDIKGTPVFQSVILAGVYDIRNLKRKLRSDEEIKVNSPWNIAADFDVDMGLSEDGIRDMLQEYEQEHHTGMDAESMAELLYNYTSGYPYLVSRLCKLIDEKVCVLKDKKKAWTKEGFLEALRMLLSENNTLFESLIGKLSDYPELNRMLSGLLFSGKTISYSPTSQEINLASMFGFIKNEDGKVIPANRIFDTVLYNHFLSADELHASDMYKASLQDKNLFITDGHLNMRRVIERFAEHFHELYGDRREKFVEEEGDWRS